MVIVSEETGIISLAYQGKLTRNLDNKTLQEMLTNLLEAGKRSNTGRGLFNWGASS